MSAGMQLAGDEAANTVSNRQQAFAINSQMILHASRGRGEDTAGLAVCGQRDYMQGND